MQFTIQYLKNKNENGACRGVGYTMVETTTKLKARQIFLQNAPKDFGETIIRVSKQ